MKKFYTCSIFDEEPEIDAFIKEGPPEGRIWLLPLGGLGEIGKNLMLLESSREIVIIDAGITFPDDDMPGIDYVMPDIRYLLMKKDKITKIVLTHGHEDHIGSLPYLLKMINVPVYGSRLTLELVKVKIANTDINENAELIEVTPEDTIKSEDFSIKFYSVTHSLSECFGLIIDTPCGRIIHSGDFKSKGADERAGKDSYAELSEKPVKLLLSDSTNSERTGFSTTEQTVNESLDRIFSKCPGRIMISSFASSLPRIKGIMTLAAKHGRKICILGKGLETTVAIAKELDYINFPKSMFVKMEDLDEYEDSSILIIATGSQGEPLSAVSSIANDSHKWVKIKDGDTVIISATPIPGNEAAVYKNINSMIRLGANVIYENPTMKEQNLYVHASGHGNQEDLKALITITCADYLMPVHGEYRHQMSYRRIAKELGYDDNHILCCENGTIIELSNGSVEKLTAIKLCEIMVDGYGIGDVGRAVLRERLNLAESGVCFITGIADMKKKEYLQGPFLSTKGLIYEKEADEIIKGAEQSLADMFYNPDIKDINSLNAAAKSEIRSFFSRKTQRKPIVISMIMEGQKSEQEAASKHSRKKKAKKRKK